MEIIYATHPSVNIAPNVLPDKWTLSEKGREDAKRLLELPFWNSVDLLYSSTEHKAIEVAEMLVSKFGFPYQSFSEFGEADRTAKPFLPFEEYMKAIAQAYAEPTQNHLGWESHADMQKRNADKLGEIIAENPGKTIAIIGHGGAGTVLKCFIKKSPIQFSEDPKQTGCYFIADWDNRTITTDWQKY